MVRVVTAMVCVVLCCGSRSSEGLTPLHVAALWGCYQNVKLLLANGGNPNVTDQVRKGLFSCMSNTYTGTILVFYAPHKEDVLSFLWACHFCGRNQPHQRLNESTRTDIDLLLTSVVSSTGGRMGTLRGSLQSNRTTASVPNSSRATRHSPQTAKRT